MTKTTSHSPTAPHPIVAALAARPPWSPGRLTRVAAPLRGGVREVSARIDGIERRWHDLATRSLDETSLLGPETPLWVVLGDSTAQGVGASTFEHGWVPRLAAALEEAGRRHLVINLSRSGADANHVIEQQLPLLEHLPDVPVLVTVSVGANDLIRSPSPPIVARRLRRLTDRTPPGAIIATLPAPRVSPTAAFINRRIRRGAEANQHRVAELAHHLIGPFRGLSTDWFHPNDEGYGAWVRAFAPPMGLDPETVPPRGSLSESGPAPARP